jgi:hypothetical protein
MTLQSSGTITMAQIAAELGESDVGMTLNDANVRALAGVSSGPISMSNFYNKTNIPAMPMPGYNGNTYAGGQSTSDSSCTLLFNATAGTWVVEGVTGNTLASGTYTTDTAVSYQYMMTAVTNSNTHTGTGSASIQGSQTSWLAITTGNSIAAVSTFASGSTAGTWTSTASATFTITISPVSEPSNTSVSTITLTASSQYTVSGCVAVESYILDNGFAGDVEVGEVLELADHISLEPLFGEVLHSQPTLQHGFRFVTESGAALRCSHSAPIPTLNGALMTPKYLLDEYVAVRRGEFTAWEKVICVEDIGEIMVQHISVNDKCFWAGEQPDAFILHHNKAT